MKELFSNNISRDRSVTTYQGIFQWQWMKWSFSENIWRDLVIVKGTLLLFPLILVYAVYKIWVVRIRRHKSILRLISFSSWILILHSAPYFIFILFDACVCNCLKFTTDPFVSVSPVDVGLYLGSLGLVWFDQVLIRKPGSLPWSCTPRSTYDSTEGFILGNNHHEKCVYVQVWNILLELYF